jgi:multidrug efflux pump subunit AcrA (membrane-fusion protein)
MRNWIYILLLLTIVSCKKKPEKVNPKIKEITESIYASGTIKSLNQYQGFVTVNGIINEIFVEEGDLVKKGDPILSISNEAQKLNAENARLSSEFSDYNTNKGRLKDAGLFKDVMLNKMKSDSTLYQRQMNLWAQQVGTKLELEQRELAYQTSKSSYFSSLVKYDDLKRQLNFNSSQSKRNLEISRKMEADFTLRSEMDGKIYGLLKNKGEIVGPQIPIAIIGDASEFLLEMQVDEYDIIHVEIGMKVKVNLDSYKGQVFEAVVSKIYPLMNERNKSFLVEAKFIQLPKIIYPNISFEANIILRTEAKALLIPRNFMLNDSTVVNSKGNNILVKTGLKDFKNIQILSGLTELDELIKPGK